MYLRFGWVVGNVGLVNTLIIVTLSTSITFLTALSIAAISTNTPVKVGGAYYMISRSLGVEIGGAIGISLYLAQTFSVALYIIGFAESLNSIYPNIDIRLISVITTVVLGIISIYSTKAAIKVQYVILGVIVLSLISLFIGHSGLSNQTENIWAWQPGMNENFWVVFAVFFPAVTGIMAGVNLSGDLKNPSQSIPKGTFLAVAVGYLIYMTIPVILSMRVDSQTLINDTFIMRKIALWGGAIILGVWGATLSSAVGSLLGAPRVMQALAKDNIMPGFLRFLSKGYGPENIPRSATIFTIIITLICVYLGNLNVIAPILTMFFLTTYGLLNATAAIEKLLESPSYRPKFKLHWFFSFFGAMGCIAVMFLINALATVFAIVFILILFMWLRRRRLKATWGDVRSGMLQQIVRYALLRLEKEIHPKSWRPNILVLIGSVKKHWNLIDTANAISQGKGLFTVATILPEAQVQQHKLQDYERQLTESINSEQIRALVRVISAKDTFTGAIQLVNSYGLGPLIPNTILLGDSSEIKMNSNYAKMIKHFYDAKRNVIIMLENTSLNFDEIRNIDIWWGGLRGNGGLMMILGYLVKNSPHWQKITVTVKMAVQHKEAEENAFNNLKYILLKMRVDFKPKIIVLKENEIFWNRLKIESEYSDLVMLGLKTPDNDFTDYYNNLKKNTAGISRKIFVLAAQNIEFKDVLN